MANGTETSKPVAKASMLRSALTGIASAVVGGLITFYALDYFKRTYGRFNLVDLALFGFGWIGGFIVAIALHEFAHALAAKVCGRSIIMFALGPVQYRRGTDGRRSIKWHPLHKAAGMVVAIGPPASHTAARDVIYAAAGPVANLLTALLIIVALTRFDVGPRLALLLLPLGFISLLIGILNLIPVAKKGLHARDGRQILDRLLGRTTPRDMAVVDILRLIVVGTRPRDWPVDILDRLDGPLDDSMGSIMADWYRYEAATDHGDIAAAGRWANRLLARVDTLSQDWIDALAPTFAFFLAFHRRDSAAAEALLNRMVREVSPTPTLTIGARSAIALAKGDLPMAITLADEAIALYRKEPGLMTPDVLDRLEELRCAAEG